MTSTDKGPIGIIGGTGLSGLADGYVTGNRETPYGGTSAAQIAATVEGREIVFLARHGEPHNIPPHKINYRANLWALHACGVREVIAVNAVGGISKDAETGVIVIPDQVIDYTYGREHSYFDGEDERLEHIDFTVPYSDSLRARLLLAAQNIPCKVVDGGVYGATQGPRLETAAEIKRMARDDCDIVGMTAMPEAALARELGLAYASVCLVVNPGAGLSDQPITMEQIHQVVATGMEHVKDLLRAMLAQ
jgi:5'-methylthioinosine phosphorylase